MHSVVTNITYVCDECSVFNYTTAEGNPPESSDMPLDKKQRAIDNEDICPICQENFLEKRQNVTYCKFVVNMVQACNTCAHFFITINAIVNFKYYLMSFFSF